MVVHNTAGEIESVEGVVFDITEQKNNEELAQYLKRHDRLTGLYNRIFFEEERRRLDRTEPTLNYHETSGDERDTTTPLAMLETLRKLIFGDTLSPVMASEREEAQHGPFHGRMPVRQSSYRGVGTSLSHRHLPLPGLS